MEGKQRRAEAIASGNCMLGIELGSTRIKAVLIGGDKEVLASGNHEWENQFVDGNWTYALEDIFKGLQDSYQKMAENVKEIYGVTIKKIGAIGFSAMMHGYMAFNKEGELLVPFRTWRNTTTGEAAKELTKLFQFNIPERWSIAHLYQAILNEESHVKEIDYLTTLAGFIHWKLTGKRVLGVGEASGMFPIDSDTKTYQEGMVEKFDELVKEKKFPWKLIDILPTVMVAGEEAGVLTKEGARILDPSGNLQEGALLCPPEGDAGTGMVATNSVAKRTGNVSAGTSVFAMIVLEKALKKVHTEIDMVTTPAGDPVAMVHANNCTSDLNAWVNLFEEFANASGMKMDKNTLYEILYKQALEGDSDCGGLLSYGYFSGESITAFEEGRPLFVRSANSKFNLANFMRSHLFTALGALKIGLDILFKEEGVALDKMLGHGGLFKTKRVGQQMMAAAFSAPVWVMETAGEGGAWGIAVLASYMLQKEEGETLDSYLEEKVFKGQEGICIEPVPEDIEGFDTFIERYKAGLPIEKAAVEAFTWES